MKRRPQRAIPVTHFDVVTGVPILSVPAGMRAFRTFVSGPGTDHWPTDHPARAKWMEAYGGAPVSSHIVFEPDTMERELIPESEWPKRERFPKLRIILGEGDPDGHVLACLVAAYRDNAERPGVKEELAARRDLHELRDHLDAIVAIAKRRSDASGGDQPLGSLRELVDSFALWSAHRKFGDHSHHPEYLIDLLTNVKALHDIVTEADDAQQSPQRASYLIERLDQWIADILQHHGLPKLHSSVANVLLPLIGGNGDTTPASAARRLRARRQRVEEQALEEERAAMREAGIASTNFALGDAWPGGAAPKPRK